MLIIIIINNNDNNNNVIIIIIINLVIITIIGLIRPCVKIQLRMCDDFTEIIRTKYTYHGNRSWVGWAMYDVKWHTSNLKTLKLLTLKITRRHNTTSPELMG